MRHVAILVLPLALVPMLAGCGGSSGRLPKDAVAMVGDEPIPKARVDSLINIAVASAKRAHKTFPSRGSSGYKSLVDGAVGYLVQAAEVEQAAAKLGISVSDSKVAAAIKKVEENSFGGDVKKLRQAMKAQGVTEDEVALEQRLTLMQRQVQAKLTKGITVSEAEARQFYEAHKSQYDVPAKRVVRHIRVDSKQLGEKIYARLKAGASFTKLAKQYSMDPGTRKQGGRVTILRGEGDSIFEQAAFSLGTGALSRLVHDYYGWEVIQALGPVHPAGHIPFSNVKSNLERQLLADKKSAAVGRWLKSVSNDYCRGKITYAVGYVPATDPCKTATTTAG